MDTVAAFVRNGEPVAIDMGNPFRVIGAFQGHEAQQFALGVQLGHAGRAVDHGEQGMGVGAVGQAREVVANADDRFGLLSCLVARQLRVRSGGPALSCNRTVPRQAHGVELQEDCHQHQQHHGRRYLATAQCPPQHLGIPFHSALSG
ncbi:hypothetical protein D3C72_1055520 [compost metagenome]